MVSRRFGRLLAFLSANQQGIGPRCERRVLVSSSLSATAWSSLCHPESNCYSNRNSLNNNHNKSIVKHPPGSRCCPIRLLHSPRKFRAAQVLLRLRGRSFFLCAQNPPWSCRCPRPDHSSEWGDPSAPDLDRRRAREADSCDFDCRDLALDFPWIFPRDRFHLITVPCGAAVPHQATSRVLKGTSLKGAGTGQGCPTTT
jgi:hypothetical protein